MAGTKKHVLAIDQGTTSTRAIVFDRDARPVATAQTEFAQHYPQGGWVEHDPEDIWRDTLQVSRDAIAQSGVSAAGVAAIGITNQRETVVVWDRASGEPIHRAIVWQDRRTAKLCAELKAAGHEPAVRARSCSKVRRACSSIANVQKTSSRPSTTSRRASGTPPRFAPTPSGSAPHASATRSASS